MGIKAFQRVTKIIELNPQKLFIVDGLGAILSAFLLGIVLVEFEKVFGIPRSTLYCLAFFPCFFALYDFYCYWKHGKNIAPFLMGIGIMNFLYCCLSIGFAIYHYQRLTEYGWAYLMLEIMLVLTLAYYELKTANEVNANA